MASPTTQPVTADPERITFQVDRLSADPPGRLEVHGRWFGVRGRRFFRPTLMLVAGGAEHRLLADLEHKPWAAQDGEDWLAAFPFELDLSDVTDVELSVAPDIAVRIGGGEGTTAVAERTPSAPAAERTPSAPAAEGGPGARGDPPARPSLSERAQEIERLTARLTELDGALARERARRGVAEQKLEDERGQALGLRSRIGQLSADLDLARAARQEAAAELEDARQSLQDQRIDSEHRRAAGERRHAENERLRGENERLQDENRGLQDHAEHLKAEMVRMRDEARAALRETRLREAESDELRAEGDRLREQVERLRMRLERAETASPVRAPSPGDEAPTERVGDPPAAVAEPDPLPTERLRARRDPPPTETLRAPPLSPSRREAEPPPRPRPAAGSERPLNPSLRGRTNWLGRALALLVILAVIAAVVLVIRTTIA
jgi:hypothetical protein